MSYRVDCATPFPRCHPPSGSSRRFAHRASPTSLLRMWGFRDRFHLPLAIRWSDTDRRTIPMWNDEILEPGEDQLRDLDTEELNEVSGGVSLGGALDFFAEWLWGKTLS